jgi:hypothetical protein
MTSECHFNVLESSIDSRNNCHQRQVERRVAYRLSATSDLMHLAGSSTTDVVRTTPFRTNIQYAERQEGIVVALDFDTRAAWS